MVDPFGLEIHAQYRQREYLAEAARERLLGRSGSAAQPAPGRPGHQWHNRIRTDRLTPATVAIWSAWNHFLDAAAS
jgi:hypothetical protein